ncbi:MAG: MBL fold metallo-hydrolase [Azoarcus sp.]|jgi:glyoxylase-like metal-dependent hydrolase (beta-lactamase superfamily II)|nr:MBL fold metallo-hydrolase [Azoarcus sp.]MDX9837915.1 MBL fold metallo-hydrolase [Azoarcus sp.]
MLLRFAIRFLVLFVLAGSVSAADLLKSQALGNGVFVLIGEIGGRTYENHALNANFGVIDTPGGAVLIDSGASFEGARLLEAQARKLTGKPVKWVINTGSQDHRWLGNGYFASRGAEVIALSRTVATQKAYAIAESDALAALLKARFKGTQPAYASREPTEDSAVLELGGRRLEIRYLANAHFPGDVVVWLPAERIVFAGDHVYMDRLLGILPQSNVSTWLDAFKAIKALAPVHVVPGHGSVTDLAGAQRDTGDYVAFVASGARRFADDMAGVNQALAALGDAPQFAHLANFAELHRGNVSRAYLRFEAGE